MDEGADEETTANNAPTMDNRNATNHLKMKDGRTTAQHETILSEILECAYVDPDDLLAKHCVSQCPFGHVPCNECAIGPIRA